MIDDGIDRDALLGVFLVEAEENLASMAESLVALERWPEDGPLLATIFRAAHTLKGNCASLRFDSVAELAGAAEDLLHELRDRRIPLSAEHITLLLRATDALKTLVPRAAAAPEPPPSPDGALVEALRQSATGSSSVPVAMTAAPPASDGPSMPVAARTTTVRVQTRKLALLFDANGGSTNARERVRAAAGASTGQEDALEH